MKHVQNSTSSFRPGIYRYGYGEGSHFNLLVLEAPVKGSSMVGYSFGLVPILPEDLDELLVELSADDAEELRGVLKRMYGR